MVTPAVFRQAVGFVQAELKVSARRACRMLSCLRSTWHYRSLRASAAKLLERMKAIATERPKFGYRRIHVLLRRESHEVNHKRVYRLYRAEGLTVRRRRRKRFAARARVVLPEAGEPNQRWSMNFVSEITASGRRFRTWNIVDDCTRECLAIVDTSIAGLRVSRELDRLIEVRGKPEMIDLPPESGPFLG
jgi:putative transposase